MPSDQRSPIDRDDVAVSLGVRQDLGRGHDDAVIGEFLDRVGHSIDAHVDERLNAAVRQPASPPVRARNGWLGFASLLAGIPITAIALGSVQGDEGIVALVVAWAGIAAVNVAHTRAQR